jgi:hypothetical protein
MRDVGRGLRRLAKMRGLGPLGRSGVCNVNDATLDCRDTESATHAETTTHGSIPQQRSNMKLLRLTELRSKREYPTIACIAVRLETRWMQLDAL